jgi:hypothetical protein
VVLSWPSVNEAIYANSLVRYFPLACGSLALGSLARKRNPSLKVFSLPVIFHNLSITVASRVV